MPGEISDFPFTQSFKTSARKATTSNAVGQQVGSAVASLLGGATNTGASAQLTTGSAKPTSNPVTPLEDQPRDCNKKENFPGHGSISPDSQWELARRFCVGVSDTFGYVWPPGTDQSHGAKPSGLVANVKDGRGIRYSFIVQWQQGCTMAQDNVNVFQPGPTPNDPYCLRIMNDNFRKCKSGPGYPNTSNNH